MRDFYYIIDNINNYIDDDFNEFLSKIKNDKKNRIKKLLKSADQKRAILGEILLIRGLKKYFNIDYDSVTITQNDNGKPYILNEPIFFNISHSFDYCICVFSTQEIGVDIEMHRPLKSDLKKYICSPQEKEQLETDEINIFNIFTLKEAYIKMNGSKISDIKNVEFEFKNNTIQCSDKDVLCYSINDITGYSIAVCIKNTI